MATKPIETEASHLSVTPIDDEIFRELVRIIIKNVNKKLTVRPKVRVFGRTCYQNRDVGFYSNKSKGYAYSNQIMESKPLDDAMESLIDYVNRYYDSNFNSILINKYNNGTEYIGAHSDDEKGIGNGGVVTISYGAIRKFRIRDKLTRKIVKDVPTTPYSMIHMAGNFQKEFTHEIPIEKKVKDARISITFRNHKE